MQRLPGEYQPISMSFKFDSTQFQELSKEEQIFYLEKVISWLKKYRLSSEGYTYKDVKRLSNLKSSAKRRLNKFLNRHHINEVNLEALKKVNIYPGMEDIHLNVSVLELNEHVINILRQLVNKNAEWVR